MKFVVFFLKKQTTSSAWVFTECRTNKTGQKLVQFQEPEKGSREIPASYPRHVGQPIGFTGGIAVENVKDWLSTYHKLASDAGCWHLVGLKVGFFGEVLSFCALLKGLHEIVVMISVGFSIFL